MANKKTKRELFGEIKEIVKENTELVAFVDHELELLDKKNGNKGQSKTQKENVDIKANLLTELAKIDGAVSISEFQAQSEYASQYSNQKISALFKQLVAENKVERTQDKKVAKFAVIAE